MTGTVANSRLALEAGRQLRASPLWRAWFLLACGTIVLAILLGWFGPQFIPDSSYRIRSRPLIVLLSLFTCLPVLRAFLTVVPEERRLRRKAVIWVMALFGFGICWLSYGRVLDDTIPALMARGMGEETSRSFRVIEARPDARSRTCRRELTVLVNRDTVTLCGIDRALLERLSPGDRVLNDGHRIAKGMSVDELRLPR